jgi:hypothetical protein
MKTVIIGDTFIAENTYPFEREGNEEDDFSYDITEGEEVRIAEFDGERYKLENVSLGSFAWVLVTPDELNKIRTFT